MIDYNLIASIGNVDADVEKHLSEAFGNAEQDNVMDTVLGSDVSNTAAPGELVSGTVVGKAGDDVIIELGLKSEGRVHRSEFENWDEIAAGDEIEVLFEGVDDLSGEVTVSKRKADRIRGWEKILQDHNEGDEIEGLGVRKIKGGLLVDIGVPVFMPASQVDIRRQTDLGDFVGRTIRAVILKIDEERRNIVISRRKLQEKERAEARDTILGKIDEGQTVTGTVTNIADFGAFIDLGGVDGLLHITDMSWGRINHPTEMLKHGQEIEVMILKIDREKEKIALGLKQLENSPWENLDERFPVNSRVKGKVVNLVTYGAFVQLDEGLEGLVHVSEMSWTRRVNHPSEVVEVDQEVEVVILEIDHEKREISLGIKQTEVNPWELVSEKYPVGTVIVGQIRNIANYGAFVEIEPGIDGLLHVSDMSWTEKVAHPNEKYQKGDTVQCVVLEIDRDKQRVGLGVKQLTEDPWINAIPENYQPGMVIQGEVTKITNFGVFVSLEDGLEGLLHISELADHKVENPQDVVKSGESVEVKILRVDTDERKIGLSLKRAQWGDNDTTAYDGNGPGGDGGGGASEFDEFARPSKGGMDDHGALGSDKIEL
jgi:small subunit ribosomal protein S1